MASLDRSRSILVLGLTILLVQHSLAKTGNGKRPPPTTSSPTGSPTSTNPTSSPTGSLSSSSPSGSLSPTRLPTGSPTSSAPTSSPIAPPTPTQKPSSEPFSFSSCTNTNPGLGLDDIDEGCTAELPFCLAEDDSEIELGESGDQCRAGTLALESTGDNDEFSILSCNGSSLVVSGNLTNRLAPGQFILRFAEDPDELCVDCKPLFRKVVSIEDGAVAGTKVVVTEFATFGEVYDPSFYDESLIDDPFEPLFDCVHSDGRRLGGTHEDIRRLQGFPNTCLGWRLKFSDDYCAYTDCFVADRDPHSCYFCWMKNGKDGCDNGCGAAGLPALSGDFGFFDFGEACCQHDYCYSTFFSKETCDDAFLRVMRGSCPDPPTTTPRRVLVVPMRAVCEAFALLFFTLVDNFGASAEARAKMKQEDYSKTEACRECDNASGKPRGGCPASDEQCCERECIDESNCCDPVVREVEQGFIGSNGATYCCESNFIAISLNRCCLEIDNCVEGATCCYDGMAGPGTEGTGVCYECCEDDDCKSGQLCCDDTKECTVPPPDCAPDNAFDCSVGRGSITRCGPDCSPVRATGGSAICHLSVEGSGFCGQPVLCGDDPDEDSCSSSAECGSGSRCAANTCCEWNVCIPEGPTALLEMSSSENWGNTKTSVGYLSATGIFPIQKDVVWSGRNN